MSYVPILHVRDLCCSVYVCMRLRVLADCRVYVTGAVVRDVCGSASTYIYICIYVFVCAILLRCAYVSCVLSMFTVCVVYLLQVFCAVCAFAYLAQCLRNALRMRHVHCLIRVCTCHAVCIASDSYRVVLFVLCFMLSVHVVCVRCCM